MEYQAWWKKKYLSNISDTLIGHNPDVMILTEFRDGMKGEVIQELLQKAGWTQQWISGAGPKTNGLFIASRSPTMRIESPVVPIEKHRWMEVEVQGLHIVALHIPIDTKQVKELFWAKVLERAKTLSSSPCMIIGDLNTGLPIDAQGAPFRCVESMQTLLTTGWFDAWRLTNGDRQQYSWYSNVGNGFRIDHVFVSEVVRPGISQCYYSHDEREYGYSDHSALIVEFDTTM